MSEDIWDEITLCGGVENGQTQDDGEYLCSHIRKLPHLLDRTSSQFVTKNSGHCSPNEDILILTVETPSFSCQTKSKRPIATFCVPAEDESFCATKLMINDHDDV